MYYPECTESSTPFQAHTLFHCAPARSASGRLSYIVNAREWEACTKRSCPRHVFLENAESRQTCSSISINKIPLISEHNCRCFFSWISRLSGNKTKWEGCMREDQEKWSPTKPGSHNSVFVSAKPWKIPNLNLLQKV